MEERVSSRRHVTAYATLTTCSFIVIDDDDNNNNDNDNDDDNNNNNKNNNDGDVDDDDIRAMALDHTNVYGRCMCGSSHTCEEEAVD